MRGLAVVVVVVCLLALAQAGWAANLDSGWYVKLSGFSTWGWDGVNWRGIDWTFSGGLGPSGPFLVTSPDVWWPQREVAVPDTIADVPAGTAVYLWATPASPVTFTISDAGGRWETFYDADEMRLDLLMYKPDDGFTLLWTQDGSGTHDGNGNLLGQFQTIPVGYEPVFRVRAIPECSSLAVLLGTLLPAAVMCRRRFS